MSATAGSRASDFVIGGAPSRHIDIETARLDMLARSWLDVQQTRKALTQRELPDEVVSSFLKAEQQLSRRLTKTLRAHPLWPWLSQFPGLGGAHTALVIGRIGDPRRFPGQCCSEGHYLPPLYAVGSACPVADASGEIDFATGDGAEFASAADMDSGFDGHAGCAGVMLPPRGTSGVRSLWHWAGLHADHEGRAPRKRKGVRGDWEPRVRASVMQPGGIAEQIVRLLVPYYVDVYRQAKARLSLRVVEVQRESEAGIGGAHPLRAADLKVASETTAGRPLRPFEADRIARKIAAKAFLGDLLVAWKALA